MKPETTSIINNFIKEHGEDTLIDLIKRERPEEEDKDSLTIISNAGLHPLHDLHKRGEIFIASTGSLNFESKESAEKILKSILGRVAQKLQSKVWRRIYLVPFGPATLSMQIKSLVYRILHQETIDILHAGNGLHYDIEIDLREIAVMSGIKENLTSVSTTDAVTARDS